MEVIGRAARSRLTLGNRAAISVTATQIFSEQGRKLMAKKKHKRGETGDGSDQITSANIALKARGSIVHSAMTTDSETVLLCSAAHCSRGKDELPDCEIIVSSRIAQACTDIRHIASVVHDISN